MTEPGILTQETVPIVKAHAIFGGRPTAALLSRETIEFPVEKKERFAPPTFIMVDCITLLVFDPDKPGRHYVIGIPVEAFEHAVHLKDIQLVQKR